MAFCRVFTKFASESTRVSVPGSRVILTTIFVPGFISNPGISREIYFTVYAFYSYCSYDKLTEK